jgi:trimeric autotransporter adhesin
MVPTATGWRALWAITTAAALALAGTTAYAGTAQAGPAQRPAAGRAGLISTVAGGVGGGPARDVALDYPCSVTSSGRHLYVGDGLVQSVDEVTGWLTTAAGGVRTIDLKSGHVPFGDGSPAKQAATDACGTAVDQDGNLVLADGSDGLVRLVASRSGTFYGQAMTAGHIYGVAGTGSGQGIKGNGGPAVEAVLADPVAVAVDSAGNLVIADSGSAHVPAEVQAVAASSGTFYGQQMTAGDIYPIAGGAAGLRVSGDGGPAVSAGLGTSIGQVQVGTAGNLVLADGSASGIRVIAERSGTFYGRPMTAGDIYTVAGDGTQGFSGDGGPATSAELSSPAGVAVDSAGNLLIADTGNNRVRLRAAATGTAYGVKVTAGDIYTIAGCGTTCRLGDGGPAVAGRLTTPDGIAMDRAGNLIVSERGSGRISDDRRVQAVAVGTGTFYGQQMTAGDIYTVAGDGTRGLAGDGGLATRAVMFSWSDRLLVDSAGNLVIPAGQNNRVRVVAAKTGTFYGIPMTAQHVYTVAGGGGFYHIGDGGPATEAGMNFPDGVAVDAGGNLMIADQGNNRVRVVAAKTGTFYGIPMTAGDIYTLAGNGNRGYSGDGGPATQATLSMVSGLAIDPAGNVVFADEGNNRVRVVATTTGTFYGISMTAGDIYTVAGNGSQGFSGDGGPAASAALNTPADVIAGQQGNLVIADQDNNRVRVVATTTGTFYGIPMTAGDIYTVAGNGSPGFSGNGGLAAKAMLFSPTGVAVDSQGNLYVADYYRVREINA